jgi:tRNA(Ile)-lysidine synthase
VAAGAHRPSPAGEPLRRDAPRIAVAVSGGIDSIALLHCTARLAAPAGVQVHALHVHHGLHPEADAWMDQVAAQCRRWTRAGRPVQFHGHRVTAGPERGDSVEAWARRVRYAALADMAHQAGCHLVLLAQHRRDQAETVLLQALRGAGPAGLAAMPRQFERAGLIWLRPWLDQPRGAIEAYARRWRLAFVHDPANADDRFARSRLRQRLWPPLQALFPDAETALAAMARRAQEVRALVDEVAAADATRAVDAQGLKVPAWMALSVPRRAALLRHWLRLTLPAAVPETLVQRLLHELPAKPAGQWPAPGVTLWRHGDHLCPVPLLEPVQAAARAIDLGLPGVHPLSPWPGELRVEAVAAGGVPVAELQDARLRPRQGGDRFQRHAAGTPRSLKKQFQDLGVPVWQRDVPIVESQGRLVFVPGLGTDARALARPGSPRVALHWQP